MKLQNDEKQPVFINSRERKKIKHFCNSHGKDFSTLENSYLIFIQTNPVKRNILEAENQYRGRRLSAFLSQSDSQNHVYIPQNYDTVPLRKKKPYVHAEVFCMG